MLIRQVVSGSNSIEKIYIVNADKQIFIEETNEKFIGTKDSNKVVISRQEHNPCSSASERVGKDEYILHESMDETNISVEHNESSERKNKTSAKDDNHSCIRPLKDAQRSAANQCFICNICQLTCTSKMHLKSHLEQTHNHMLPYECTFCVSGEIKNIIGLNKHFSQHDQKKILKCNYCQARFDSIIHRRIHQQGFHLEERKNVKCIDSGHVRRYACRYCWKRFAAKSSFDRHERNHEMKLLHAGALDILDFANRCNVCDKQCASKDTLEDHLKTHADLLPYYCDKCVSSKVTIGSVRLLNKHIALHIDEKSIQCLYCIKTFITISDCKEHEKLHHDQITNFECETCENSTMNSTDTVKANNTETARFQCAYCENSYSLLSSLRRHENVHTRIRQYICNICGKIFNKSSCLLQHERTHAVNVPYKCDFCGKSFKETIRLVEHKRIHTGEKPFQCNNCQKQFRIKQLLNGHLAKCASKETSLLVFQCEYCNQSLLNKQQLIDHALKLHPEHLPRDGRCRYCDLKVNEESTLFEHELQHKQPGAIECQQCGKIFKQKSNLRRHLRLHILDAKLYKCDICDKSFTQASTMKAHRRVHTGEKPYTCELCGKTFHYSSTMKRHKRFHYQKDSRLFLFVPPAFPVST
ncbi:zinc finger protein ZFP2-like [Anopheles nili]|uniref:zinc finger protein ZFP2-like n=1 Tax=Anopheles nili TaxID=185578 RepID=UPI00237AD887|nr:zinc finger protein ZFP2-like [Anopheles nili]